METPTYLTWAGRHAVELYVRTYATMLQSSGEIKVDSLVQTHIRMGSVLHPLAAQPQTDMGALLYATRELGESEVEARRADLAASYQSAVVGQLVAKLERALRSGAWEAVALGGGVAANGLLRGTEPGAGVTTWDYEARDPIAKKLLRRHGVPMIGTRLPSLMCRFAANSSSRLSTPS